jgi:uncharacterized membrane protein HdeD (DUF308 family)
MIGQGNKFEKMPIWSVVLGVVILCGVLLTAYGFYRSSEIVLYVGLAVTIMGALDGIFFLVVSPAELRVRRHRPREARSGR